MGASLCYKHSEGSGTRNGTLAGWRCRAASARRRRFWRETRGAWGSHTNRVGCDLLSHSAFRGCRTSVPCALKSVARRAESRSSRHFSHFEFNTRGTATSFCLLYLLCVLRVSPSRVECPGRREVSRQDLECNSIQTTLRLSSPSSSSSSVRITFNKPSRFTRHATKPVVRLPYGRASALNTLWTFCSQENWPSGLRSL